jgi:hypothetical protein
MDNDLFNPKNYKNKMGDLEGRFKELFYKLQEQEKLCPKEEPVVKINIFKKIILMLKEKIKC